MRKRGAGAAGGRSRWVSRIGSGLVLVGGLGGLIAVLLFTQSYLSSAYPELRLAPDLITLEVLDARVSGFRSLETQAAGFLLSCLLALATAIEPSSRLGGVVVLLLGTVLTIVSLFGGFSVGGYTLYGAMGVLAGGMLLVAARWESSRSA
ncbi:MAG: hypothetical protein M1570_10400 [Chloroflexi bacterium]|nr:hypothetical protein [Chloroflexota bacterium]